MRSYAVTSLFVGALAVFVLALLADRGDLIFVALGLVTFAAGFALGLIPSDRPAPLHAHNGPTNRVDLLPGRQPGTGLHI